MDMKRVRIVENIVIFFAILSINACAAWSDTPVHGFSFDAINESPEIEILDYQYGNSKLPGVKPSLSDLQRGNIAQRTAIYGPMLRGSFLRVKWRIKKTGETFEISVDLNRRLPSDITGDRIHFVVNRKQLLVYLITLEEVQGNCASNREKAIKNVDSHDLVLFAYCNKNVLRIYPN